MRFWTIDELGHVQVGDATFCAVSGECVGITRVSAHQNLETMLTTRMTFPASMFEQCKRTQDGDIVVGQNLFSAEDGKMIGDWKGSGERPSIPVPRAFYIKANGPSLPHHPSAARAFRCG